MLVVDRKKTANLLQEGGCRVVCHAIASNLNCWTHLHYGSTESGLGGAVECPGHAGCHIRENDLLFEVVDPDTGEQLPDQTEGELVFSTITRTGMPLLRYRTGDWGSITRDRCSCGSMLARLQNLNGRLDNMAWLSTGERLTMAELDQAILTIPWITGYEAALDDEPNSDYTQSVQGLSQKTVLRIRTKVLSSQPCFQHEAIRTTVFSIPSVHRAVVSGLMRIEINDHQDQLFPSHTAKRRLEDNRNQPYG